jgi:hypothetical protein
LTTIVQEPPALDAREARALEYLRPALSEAVARNRSVRAAWIPTSLSSSELVALSVRLCRHAGANVAVLAHPESCGVIFTPV